MGGRDGGARASPFIVLYSTKRLFSCSQSEISRSSPTQQQGTNLASQDYVSCALAPHCALHRTSCDHMRCPVRCADSCDGSYNG